MDKEIIKCGHCHSELEYGVHVCRYCNSDIVYGATQEELTAATGRGMMLGGGVVVLLLYIIPFVLKVEFIKPGFGLDAYGLFLVAVAAIFLGHKFREKVERENALMIRMFRHKVIK